MTLISVIIPTYNCSDFLEKTLESLCHQSLAHDRFEVIVADDGSSDNTKELTFSFSQKLNIQYCYQQDQGFRAAKVRNLGLAQAKGEYILFLDSGVVLHANSLQIHIDKIEEDTSCIHIGFCHGFEEHFVAKNKFSQLLADNNFSELFIALSAHNSNQDCRQKLLNEIGHIRGYEAYPWLFCWGGHLFGKAASFRDITGFDESFTHWGGEDVELGLRLHKAGYQFKLVLEAMAYHIPHPKAETANAEATHNNCHYIHAKHQLPITGTMITKDWEDIIRSVG
ncbi:glycosyltransferase [Photobacterium minamisatsumaniensis]|uniref:glycosyltransferase n=1 Tax=Photobacterium minamisatsumaniensis TaxID=2910233 RepID=UPI003D0E2B05